MLRALWHAACGLTLTEPKYTTKFSRVARREREVTRLVRPSTEVSEWTLLATTTTLARPFACSFIYRGPTLFAPRGPNEVPQLRRAL